MALPREVSLHTVDGKLRLVQHVTGGLAAPADPAGSFIAGTIEIGEGRQILKAVAGTVQRIEVTFTPGTAGEFGLVVRGDRIRGDWIQGTRIGIRPAEGRIFVDRRRSGQTGFHESLPSIGTAPIRTADGTYQLTVYVDRCSVEIFAQHGQVTLTELVFPSPTSTGVCLFADGGTATARNVSVTQYA